MVDAGGSTTISNAVSVSATNGFQGNITLTCSVHLANGNPANASCSTSPTTVTTIPSQVGVTVDATSLNANQSASNGYQFVVQGTSGSLTHLVAVPFNVGDYQLSWQQSTTAPAGGRGAESLTITTTTYYAGRINATCDASSLPGATNSTCSLNPVDPILVNVGATVPVTATINVPVNAPPGNYNIKVNSQDANGLLAHNLTFSLTVQDFQIHSSTTSQTITTGQTAAYDFTIQPVGTSFSNAVSLTCLGLPSGAECLFSPSASVTPGRSGVSVVMTTTTEPTTLTGTYTVTIIGTSGSLIRSASISLVITSSGTTTSPDFQLTISRSLPL